MKLTFIGAGNMGGAIARSLMSSGAFTPQDIQIISRNRHISETFARLGATTTPNSLGDAVIVAVKPWQLEGVTPLLAEFEGVIISIAAQTTLAELHTLWGANKTIVRVMPNTAVEALAGISFVAADNVEVADWVAEIFSPLGASFVVSEGEFEACTALGSCGLAYALRYARASMLGATELGLKPAEAQKIVAGVLRGAAALLEQDGAHPETEIDKITTPGGFTIKGLNAMERGGFTTAVIEGLKYSK